MLTPKHNTSVSSLSNNCARVDLRTPEKKAYFARKKQAHRKRQKQIRAERKAENNRLITLGREAEAKAQAVDKAAKAKIEAEAKALVVNAPPCSAKNKFSAIEDNNLVPVRKLSSEEYAEIEALECCTIAAEEEAFQNRDPSEFIPDYEGDEIVEDVEVNTQTNITASNGAAINPTATLTLE